MLRIGEGIQRPFSTLVVPVCSVALLSLILSIASKGARRRQFRANFLTRHGRACPGHPRLAY
jgi:hypothetical protein